jgi:DNA invertase Pin-like site-specific DNA recombinase
MRERICLFLRVSTHRQEVERQRTELMAYCDQRGFDVVHTIASIVSGRKRSHEREDVQELLYMAKKRMFTKVVVTEVSRIGRNAKDIQLIIDTLHSFGVSVVFKNLGGLESLENGKTSFVVNIIIAIYAEMAEEDLKLLSNRIKSGLVHAKSKGKQLGRPRGPVPTDEVVKRYPKLVKDILAGESLTRCQLLHNVSRTTVVKVKKLVLGRAALAA